MLRRDGLSAAPCPRETFRISRSRVLLPASGRTRLPAPLVELDGAAAAGVVARRRAPPERAVSVSEPVKDPERPSARWLALGM